MAKNPNGGGATPAIKVVKVKTGHGPKNVVPKAGNHAVSKGSMINSF